MLRVPLNNYGDVITENTMLMGFITNYVEGTTEQNYVEDTTEKLCSGYQWRSL